MDIVKVFNEQCKPQQEFTTVADCLQYFNDLKRFIVNTQAISLSTFMQQQQVVPDLESSSPEVQLLYSATG